MELKSNTTESLPKSGQPDYHYLRGIFNSQDELSLYSFTIEPSTGYLTQESTRSEITSYLDIVNKLMPLDITNRRGDGFLNALENGKVTQARDSFPSVGIDFHKIKYLLLNFPDPKVHIGVASNILRMLHDETIDIKRKELLATIALYIFAPIAEIFGETDLLIQIQNSAFAILSEEEYKDEVYSRKYLYGEEPTYTQFRSARSYIKSQIAHIANIDLQDIEVLGRRKSFLSDAQKGGEPQDLSAITIAINTSKYHIPDSLISGYLEDILIKLLNSEDFVQFDDDGEKIGKNNDERRKRLKNSIRDPNIYGDKMYRVIKTPAVIPSSTKGKLSGITGPISISITTTKNAHLMKVRHPYYKRLTRLEGGNAAKHFAQPSAKDVDIMADFAITNLKRIRENDPEIRYTLNNTLSMVNRYLMNLSQGNVMAYTVRGNHMIPLKDSALFDQIQSFVINIRRVNSKKFTIRRRGSNGTQMFLIDLDYSDKSAHVYSSTNPTIEIQNFELENFDSISVDIEQEILYTNVFGSSLTHLAEKGTFANKRVLYIENTRTNTRIDLKHDANWRDKIKDFTINPDDRFNIITENRNPIITANEVLKRISDAFNDDDLENFTFILQSQLEDFPDIYLLKRLLEQWALELLRINKALLRDDLKIAAEEDYLKLQDTIKDFLNQQGKLMVRSIEEVES